MRRTSYSRALSSVVSCVGAKATYEALTSPSSAFASVRSLDWQNTYADAECMWLWRLLTGPASLCLSACFFTAKTLQYRPQSCMQQAALSQEAEEPLQADTFRARDLTVQQTTTSRVRTPLEVSEVCLHYLVFTALFFAATMLLLMQDIKWGTEFSDHMFLAEVRPTDTCLSR